MSDTKDLGELAATLAERLQKQAGKWLAAIYEEPYTPQQIREREEPNLEAGLSVVAAFQIAHVMSVIRARKYIDEDQISSFEHVLVASLHGPPSDDLMADIKQYQFYKEIDYPGQLVHFCEHVSMAITGSVTGMNQGPALIGMARDFLISNWAIVADHFGDHAKLEECLKFMRSLRDWKTP